jgi:hypothetical protein
MTGKTGNSVFQLQIIQNCLCDTWRLFNLQYYYRVSSILGISFFTNLEII